MSAFIATASSTLVTTRPCRLLSFTLTPSSAASGDATLYDGHGAVTADAIATIRTANSQTTQLRFDGLECDKGLYISVGSNVTLVTVEWDPIAPVPA